MVRNSSYEDILETAIAVERSRPKVMQVHKKSDDKKRKAPEGHGHNSEFKKGIFCHYCHKEGHVMNDCRKRVKKDEDIPPRCMKCGRRHRDQCRYERPVCWNCKQEGHKKENCPTIAYNQRQTFPQNEDGRNARVHAIEAEPIRGEDHV